MMTTLKMNNPLNNSNMERKKYYKTETWLNPEDSPSTGSIVCYDGDVEYTEGEAPCMFVEIADCHNKVRLHCAHTDTTEQFIDKLDKVINSLKRFRSHLIYQSPHKPIIRGKK